jgi:hypothetical protein
MASGESGRPSFKTGESTATAQGGNLTQNGRSDGNCARAAVMPYGRNFTQDLKCNVLEHKKNLRSIPGLSQVTAQGK